MDAPAPKYDPALWFHHTGCSGNHYLLGNPHTFAGRMYAWCPLKQRTFFVSKSAIGDSSPEAKYLVMGFLHGAEPAPPTDLQGDTDFDSAEYRAWIAKVSAFQESGSWVDAEQDDHAQ